MPMIDPVIHLVLQYVLAAIFVFAVYHKVSDVRIFRAILGEYRLLPGGLLWPGALMVIMGELLAAIGLILGLPFAYWLAVGLFGLYTLGFVINIARDRRGIDCGCSGLGTSNAGRL